MKLSTRFAWMSAATLPILIIAAGAALVPWETADLRAERDAHLHARAELLLPRAASLAESLTAQSADPALQAPDDAVVIATRTTSITVGDAPTSATLPATDGPFSLRNGARVWRGYATSDPAAETRVWVVEPEAVLTAKVRRLRGRVWLMALIVSPVAFGVGALLGRRTIRPLTVLRHRADRVSAGHGARIDLRTGVEEIDEVAAVLDTALARRDEQERQTVEAWQAARSFAATAAHELRTPLTAVQTALDVLEHPGADADDRGAALADLRQAHTRVLGLLDVLRALSRVELTRPESFTDVDLADLAELALHAARSRHPGTRFEFRCETGDLTMTGWADGLRMVIDNLLDNAAVHGTGGAVILGIPGPSQEPDSIMMTVDDEGPGIPPDLRPRIFERFSKSSTSRGFGLGLTIVAQVVALHGGTVEASSPPSGRGTRFTVRLPSQGFPKVPS